MPCADAVRRARPPRATAPCTESARAPGNGASRPVRGLVSEHSARVVRFATVPVLRHPASAKPKMTDLVVSNIPPVRSRERAASRSLPIEMRRPGRHSSRSRTSRARRHATFPAAFRLPRDTARPQSVHWRSTSRSRPPGHGQPPPRRPRSSRDHAVHGLHRVRADATLLAVRAIVANPTAVDGGEQMNKADLVSHVAAETSVTRTTAERMVGAVVTAIGDALARGEPVAIAGFGKFATRSRAARRGRNPQNVACNMFPKPGNPSPSRPRGRRRSRQRRHCATRSTRSVPPGSEPGAGSTARQ